MKRKKIKRAEYKPPLRRLLLALKDRTFLVFYRVSRDSRRNLPCDYCGNTNDTVKMNVTVHFIFEGTIPILHVSNEGENVIRKMNEIYLSSLVGCDEHHEYIEMQRFQIMKANMAPEK